MEAQENLLSYDTPRMLGVQQDQLGKHLLVRRSKDQTGGMPRAASVDFSRKARQTGNQVRTAESNNHKGL